MTQASLIACVSVAALIGGVSDVAWADPGAIIEQNATTGTVCVRRPSTVSGGIVTPGACISLGTNGPSGFSADAMSGAKAGGVTGTTSALLSDLRPYYDVRLSGAKLDGSSDDTSAFNAAQALLGAAGGGTLWVPKPIIVCGAVVQYSNITIRGPNEQQAWLQPASTSCPKWIALGDSTHPVTGVQVDQLGFKQPVVNATGLSSSTSGQTSGTAVSFDNCYMCGVHNFFARNAWDLFTTSNLSGAIFADHGQIRTVNHNLATITGTNDLYFDHIVADYDTLNGPGGLQGNSNACFQINSSPGSVVISDSDFIHCGFGLNAAPTGGAGVEWLFVNNTAFDTCTSNYGGAGVKFNPTGADANSNPSYIHGGKFTNSWSSGCQNGVLTASDSVGFTEAMAFDNFSAQGNGQEGVLLGGNARSFSFVNLEAFRNSSSAANTYAGVRLAGSGGVGNVSFVGGKIGGITDTPIGGTAHVFSKQLYGIKFDAGWNGTAAVVGVDLCGYGSGGAGLSVNGANVTAAAGAGSNISVVGSPCATQ